MTRQLLLMILTLTTSLAVFGQVTTEIHYNGHVFFMVKDSGGVTNNIRDCIFCDPEIMTDRILLDSSKTMIARKTSNPFGYTYFEWRGKNHSKSYEEIQFRPLKYRTTTYWTDSGSVMKQTGNPLEVYTHYFFNNHNRWSNAERILLKQNQQASDSLIKLYKIPKNNMHKGTTFWTELNFYENDKLKSTGIMIIEPKEEQLKKSINQYKIGNWLYYNAKGQLYYKEIISTIRKVDK